MTSTVCEVEVRNERPAFRRATRCWPANDPPVFTRAVGLKRVRRVVFQGVTNNASSAPHEVPGNAPRSQPAGNDPPSPVARVAGLNTPSSGGATLVDPACVVRAGFNRIAEVEK